MIYLDSSALMKLVREEHETVALGEWLNARPDQAVVTSELGRIEVLRAARRVGGQVQTEARAVVGDLDLVPLDRAVQALACEIPIHCCAPSTRCTWLRRYCSARS